MRRLAAVGLAGLLLGLASVSSASGAGSLDDVVVVGGGGGGSGSLPFGRAKVRTDGTLTIGQVESLFVRRIPTKPKLKLSASVYPQFESAPDCFSLRNGFCEPEPLFPAPGTARLHATHKGRASLTFVMPAAVEFENFADPLQDHPVPFANGERIQVDLEGTRKIRHGTLTGPIATTFATAEVPSSP